MCVCVTGFAVAVEWDLCGLAELGEEMGAAGQGRSACFV